MQKWESSSSNKLRNAILVDVTFDTARKRNNQAATAMTLQGSWQSYPNAPRSTTTTNCISANENNLKVASCQTAVTLKWSQNTSTRFVYYAKMGGVGTDYIGQPSTHSHHSGRSTYSLLQSLGWTAHNATLCRPAMTPRVRGCIHRSKSTSRTW